MTCTTLAALAALLPALALADPPSPPESPTSTEEAPAAARKVRPRRDRDGLSFDLRVAALAGAFDGHGVRREQGALGVVEADLTPKLRAGRLTIEVPLRFDHRETLGAELRETRASLAVEPEYRLSRSLRAGAELGGALVSRPGWDDLYQRNLDGSFESTDRYGYRVLHAGARVKVRPASRQRLELRYRFARFAAVEDGAFTLDDPMHLTPRDNDTHQVDASWRIGLAPYAVTLGMEYAHRADDVLLARDAGTGATSDALSGEPNPLQRLDTLEPWVEVELARLGGRLGLSLRYGYALQDDPFAGYYSYVAHHPRLAAELELTPRVTAEAEVEGLYRTYGAEGTRPSRLESGDRRVDSRTAVALGARWEVGEGVALRASGEWTTRRTNYPDYQPDPLTGAGYDIRWDYDNLRALVGIEYRR